MTLTEGAALALRKLSADWLARGHGYIAEVIAWLAEGRRQRLEDATQADLAARGRELDAARQFLAQLPADELGCSEADRQLALAVLSAEANRTIGVELIGERIDALIERDLADADDEPPGPPPTAH